MQHEDVVALVDHLYWVRDRILTAAASMPEAEFRTPETSATRDLRATLVHQLENEWAWRIRLDSGAFPDNGLDPEDYPAPDVLAERWRREEHELRAWLGQLSDAQLAACPPGDDDLLPLWRYLVYVVTHGIAQFTEAAVILTRLGRSPGEIGFLRFSLEADGPAPSQGLPPAPADP